VFNISASARRWAIAVDHSGRVIMMGFNMIQVLQNGNFVTLAGVRDEQGTNDGEGAQARFSEPAGMAVDMAGNLYVADREVIRKVTPTGTVSTVAGTRGSLGLRFGALPGSLNKLNEIAIGPDGVLYAISGEALIKVKLQ
jgi:hypothetical protein